LFRRCFLHFYATTLETDLTIQQINDITTLAIKVWGGSIAVYSVMCDTLDTVQRITVFLRQKNSIAGYDLKQYTFKVLAPNILQLSSSSTIEAGISMTTQNEKAEIQLSPDYQYLAIAYQEGTEKGFVRLYENNNANFVLYGCYKVAGSNTGSLDFSPESKYLYLVSHTAANRGIIRLNVGLLPPNNTPTEVASQAIDYATTLFNLNNTAITGIAYSSIRRAKNGNMYVAYTGSRQLFAIKNPDVANIANITTLSVQLTQALKGGISAQPIIYYSLSKRSGNEPQLATLERGSKVYELNDHLGNVHSVVSDVKEPILSDAPSGSPYYVIGSPENTTDVPYNSLTDNDNFRANILTLNNYYPYGMLQPGRSVSSGTYRFGYQGQEMDNAISGTTGTHTTAQFWEYDTRAVKRWNTDPITYPWHGGYTVFNANPIIHKDPDGQENIVVVGGADVSGNDREKFFNTGLRSLEDYSETQKNEKTTLVVMTAYMTSEEMNVLSQHVSNLRGKGKNVDITFVNDASELTNYFNYKNSLGPDLGDPNSENQRENRYNDPITDVAIFSHGYALNGGSLEPGHFRENSPDIARQFLPEGESDLRGYDQKFSWDIDDAYQLDPKAFSNPQWQLYSCNAATEALSGKNLGLSLAGVVSSQTSGIAVGFLGKSEYSGIYGNPISMTLYGALNGQIHPAPSYPGAGMQNDRTTPSETITYKNGVKQ
jgi:hypothetical protein